MVRENLKSAKRIVIKVGSRILLEEDGKPNYPQIAHLVEQIANLKKNREIIFVSSGAVGAGMEALSLKKRPTDLPTLQAAAAIGQVRLMRAYEDLFLRYNTMVAQVLLTHDDLQDRKRHLNIKNTLNSLMKRGIIPIINENDTVSIEELKFGDNDVLASLVAMLLEAKALVLLTTTEGFMIKEQNGEQKRVPHIYDINQEILKHIEEHKIGLSTGGMKSKLEAAANMIHVGAHAIIASGHIEDALEQIFIGANIGTVVGKPFLSAKQMPGRKRWIAFYNKPKGQVIVDEGAKMAIAKHGKSLLSVGVIEANGSFKKGQVIEILDRAENRIAKGISKIDEFELNNAIKKDSIKKRPSLEVVHRDDLVVMGGDV